MKGKKDASDLMATVRKMRAALSETQNEFAARLGVGIATVVRYEHSRAPREKALAKLEQVAVANGLDEYAAVFRRALTKELGAAPPPATPDAMHLRDSDEREAVQSLLVVLRKKKYANEAKTITAILAPITEERLRDAEYDDARNAMRNAIVRFLQKGHPAQEAVRAFTTSMENVAEALFNNGDAALIQQRRWEMYHALSNEGWSVRKFARRFHLDADEVRNYAAEHGLEKQAEAYEEDMYGQDEDEQGL